MYNKFTNRLIQLNQTFGKVFSQSFDQKYKVILKSRSIINHDTYIFTFAFEDSTVKVEQFVSQHYVLYGNMNDGNFLSRKYTAISPLSQQGSFSIPIKIYRPNTHPLFPVGGEFTPWLEQLEVGSEIWVEKRIGPLVYLGEGSCILRPKVNQNIELFKNILMICGGTGITPMFQLMQRVLSDPDDPTKIFLIYANKSEHDILLRKELEAFTITHPERFKLLLTLDNVQDQWKGQTGYVNLEMMKQNFPLPNNETLGTSCGPKAMNQLVLGLYKEFGLIEDHIIKF